MTNAVTEGAVDAVVPEAAVRTLLFIRLVTAGAATFPYARYFQTSWPAHDEPAAVESLLAPSGRVWIVDSFPEYMNARVAAFLTDRCGDRRVFSGTVGGGDVIVCTVLGKGLQ